MKRLWIGVVICVVSVSAVVWGKDVQVLSNGMGKTKPFPGEMIGWYAKNHPRLPLDYTASPDWIHYEPLLHYLDNVNWSLFTLRQFKEISKDRWVRVPAGKKIKRDAKTGAWILPVGTESAKIFRARTLDADGDEQWQDIELRLLRKIRETKDPREGWAMGLYVRDKDGWKATGAPHLELKIERALVPEGKPRTVTYALTAVEACMTCHARSSDSTVDLKRGNGFLYGANDELLTGRTRVRLSQWLSSPEMQEETKELARDAKEDWIDLVVRDLDRVEKNREAFSKIVEGELPPLE